MPFRPTALIPVSLAALAAHCMCSAAHAQMLTTGAIHGTVVVSDGTDAEGAAVHLTNVATGTAQRAEVRHGRFLFHGLEVGGPYTLTVQRIGLRSERVAGIVVRLGEPIALRVLMRPLAVSLESVDVAVQSHFPDAGAGASTRVTESSLRRLPTLDRNLYDFLTQAPQVSSKIGFGPGGISVAGAGFRFNSFLVNGVPQRSIGGHVPPEFAGARSLPFDAVAEYQVLVAPFDVRYGDFAGGLVNAVTRSGTTRLQGSAFVLGRNDALSRAVEDEGVAYERLQYGLSVGGPAFVEGARFFAATDFQHHTSPAPGPYVAGAATASGKAPVSVDQLDRMAAALGGFRLVAGSGGRVENSNPVRSLFGRLDLELPRRRSRVVAWLARTRARNLDFSREGAATFPLTSNVATLATSIWNASAQVHTTLRRAAGGHNELLVSYRSAATGWHPEVRQPLVRVSMPHSSGGTMTVVAGTPQHAQGSALGGSGLHIRDDLTLPIGASHVLTLGLEVERFRAERMGIPNAYGTWTFSSLDSLATGLATRFEAARDFGGANVPLTGGHYAAYAGDRWAPTDRFSVSLGARIEAAVVDDRPPYNAAVDSLFGRRTDRMPERRVYLSPRGGVNWVPGDGGIDRVRAGVGVFTGRPPAAWLHAPLYSYGVGTATLRCGDLPGDQGPPPQFRSDYRSPPAQCGNGVGLDSAPAGEVALTHPRLGPARTLRALLAYDRYLSKDLFATVELLTSRGLSDFVFVNLNLAGPQGTDRHGRILYGGIAPSGVAEPARRSAFADVIELRNTGRNRALQASVRLERRPADGFGASAHYTFSRVRDVQTPLRVYNPAAVNWASRPVSGRHDDLRAGVSLNDIPHRLVLVGTLKAPWRRWPTELSFSYIGESGSPFTYRAWGAALRGDLNADGSASNDPVYVPRDARDAGEIVFAPLPVARSLPGGGTRRDTIAPARQAAAYEAFIESTPCLRRQRGRIAERNSCREPWSHRTSVSVRQTVPIARREVQLQLDIFNLLALLRPDWGRHRIASPELLEHVGQTDGPSGTTQPVFHFRPRTDFWTSLPSESTAQAQIGLRYGF